MRVYSAHDGAGLDVSQPLRTFSTVSALADVVSLVTGIVADSVILITEDGAQLTDDLLVQLVDAQMLASHSVSPVCQIEPDLFVFSRDILSAEPELVAPSLQNSLVLELPLNSMQVVRPPTPYSLQDLVANVEHAATVVMIHAQRADGVFSSMEVVRKGSHVALLNLIQHADSIQQASEELQRTCKIELQRMRYLLDAYEGALAALDLVSVRNELLLPSSASAGTNASSPTGSYSSHQPPRFLSSWINKDRMRSVASEGQGVYDIMTNQIQAISSSGSQHHAAMVALQDDAGPVSTQFASDSRDEAVQASGRTQELAQYVFDVASPDANGWPVADKLNDEMLASLSGATDEIVLCDEVARDANRRLTTELNTARLAAVHQLSRVSYLQSVYADYGGQIALAQESLSLPASPEGPMKAEYFRYLQRLVSILPAYAATVVERVRRAEFAQEFLHRSTAFAELMANFGLDDTRKRQRYDAAHRKHLPWEIRGLDRPSPGLNIKTEWTESEPELTRPSRQHIYELLTLLDQIDRILDERARKEGDGDTNKSTPADRAVVALSPHPSANEAELYGSTRATHPHQPADPPSPTEETRTLLHKLLAELDAVPQHFEHLVGIHLLGEEPEDDNSSDPASEADDDAERDPFALSFAQSTKATEGLPTRFHALKRLILQERKTHSAALQAMQDERDDALAVLTHERAEVNRRAAEAEEFQADVRHLRADADMKDQRHLNLLDELTAQRRELETLRRADRDAQQAAEDDAVRIAELEEALAAAQVDAQSQADLVAAAQSAQAAAEAKANQTPPESPSHRAELAAAQADAAELRNEVSTLRCQLLRQQEVTRAAEHEKDKIKRTARAGADADAALVAQLKREADSAARDLGSARRAARAAAGDADALTDALAALRAQLAAADEDHVTLTRRVESVDRARQAADTVAATVSGRYLALLFPAVQWAHALLGVRSALLAMPAMTSRFSHSGTGAASAGVSPSHDQPTSTEEPVLQQAQTGALDGFLAALVKAAPKMSAPTIPPSGESAAMRPRSHSAVEPPKESKHPSNSSTRIPAGHLSDSRPHPRSPTPTRKSSRSSFPALTALPNPEHSKRETNSVPLLTKFGFSPPLASEDTDRADTVSVDKVSAVTAPEPGTNWEDTVGVMDPDLLELESALGLIFALFSPSAISNEAKFKLESLVRVVKKWMKAYRSVKDNYDRVRARLQQGNGTSTSITSPQEQAKGISASTAALVSPNTAPPPRTLLVREGDRLAFTSFVPGDLALFLPTREPGPTGHAPTWAAFNVAAPHHFLNTLPPEHSAGPADSATRTATLVRDKQWLVARVTRVAVYTAGSSEPLAVLPKNPTDSKQSQDGDQDGQKGRPTFMTNPFRLPLGITYYVLDAMEYVPSAAHGSKVSLPEPTSPEGIGTTDTPTAAPADSQGEVDPMTFDHATQNRTDHHPVLEPTVHPQ